MNKSPVIPTIEYSFLTSLVPFSPLPSLALPSSNSVLYIPGDLHDQRHPAAIRFSTSTARDEFKEIVTKFIRPPRGIREAGEKAVERMKEKVGGRKWLGAHLRRGDFLKVGWSKEGDPIVDFEKTKKALQVGIKELNLRSTSITLEEIPLSNDSFYLATDESNPTSLSYYKSHGATLLSDLISTEELFNLIGPSSSYTDILALVEQQILSQSDFFVGNSFSSTTGGVLNLRESKGKEDWSWSLL